MTDGIPCWRLGRPLCRGDAVRFFSLPSGGLVAGCGPCVLGWLREIGSWRHEEIPEARYRELAEVQEVMES